MQNKGKIFKSGLIFIILSGIIILIFSCLTVFLTKKLSSAPFVEKMIKDKVGLNSSIINPKVKLAGIYLTFMADDIILYGESEKKPFVDIKDLKLKVSPLKVLTKKISILEFNSSDIFLNLSRENDGSLDITKYLKNNNKSKFKIDFTPLKSYILRYNINYADKIINSGFNIKGSSLLIEDLNIQKQLKFETLGQISINTNNTIYNSPYLLNIEYTKKGKNIDLKKQEILISGIDISFLKNYLSKFGFKTLNSKIDIVSFAKNSNMFKLYFVASNTNMAFDYKGDTNTIISNDPLINEVDFTFDSKDLIIDKGLFVGNGFNFSYSGNIKNVTNLKNLEAQLSLKIANSDLKSILAILPDTVLPLQEPYIKNMKRYNANALIDGNVDFKYKNKDEYGAKGKLDFYDVYVVKRPDCAPTSFGTTEMLI